MDISSSGGPGTQTSLHVPSLEGALFSSTPEGSHPWHPSALTTMWARQVPVYSTLLHVCVSPQLSGQGESACACMKAGSWGQEECFPTVPVPDCIINTF